MPTFELRLPDGTPAGPPILNINAPIWNVGDVIPIAAGKALRVVAVHAPSPCSSSSTRLGRPDTSWDLRLPTLPSY
jgi:hypothetical protein